MPSGTTTSTRSGLLTERTPLYGGGARVSVTPFPRYLRFTLEVRKQRGLLREGWEPARFSTPMTCLDTAEDVTAYGRALLLLAEIGAELDAEFADG